MKVLAAFGPVFLLVFGQFPGQNFQGARPGFLALERTRGEAYTGGFGSRPDRGVTTPGFLACIRPTQTNKINKKQLKTKKNLEKLEKQSKTSKKTLFFWYCVIFHYFLLFTFFCCL